MFDKTRAFAQDTKGFCDQDVHLEMTRALGGYAGRNQQSGFMVAGGGRGSWLRQCPHLWGRRPWKGRVGWRPDIRRSGHLGVALRVSGTNWKGTKLSKQDK